jgi:hypothetical protein
MNDLEDLVRQELRAHVDAAEARKAEEPPSVLLGALDRRIRRARLRRRWTVSALSVGVIAAAITLPLALLSPRTPIAARLLAPRASAALSDTAATPRGWAPVAYGNVQISVPSGWAVASSPVCGRTVPGYVVLGSMSTRLAVRIHAASKRQTWPPSRRCRPERARPITGRGRSTVFAFWA